MISGILDLIPQRPPMQMIDRLLTADEKSATGSLFIKDDNLFIRNGRLSESALIEFIAQTAAAFTGYRNKINNAAVTEGYIGAVKNLVIHDLPAVNTEIFSGIEVVNEIVGFTIVTGKVFCRDASRRVSESEDVACNVPTLIAECEMRILLSH